MGAYPALLLVSRRLYGSWWMLARLVVDASTVRGECLHGSDGFPNYPLCPPDYLLCLPNYLLGIAKVPVYARRVNDGCGRKQEQGGTGLVSAKM